MEFLYVIPAIIVLVYWIAEASKINIFKFNFSKAASPLDSSENEHFQFEAVKKELSLTDKVKKAIQSSGLSYVMDEEDGMAWIMLSDDDQFCDCRDVFISIQTDVNIITYSIGIINELKDEDIMPMTELCNRLNDRITYGRFVFDYSDASVRLVIYYHLMTDAFNLKRHKMYLGALLQYKLDIEPCFTNVKIKKELPIIAAMGR